VADVIRESFEEDGADVHVAALASELVVGDMACFDGSLHHFVSPDDLETDV
jgi:hypothetical protein